MEQWVPLIANVGFPIVVTLYLLHRVETKLDAVVLAIEKLSQHFNQKLEP
ncbi:YvrJ family protein [Ectobacillus polymachus]